MHFCPTAIRALFTLTTAARFATSAVSRASSTTIPNWKLKIAKKRNLNSDNEQLSGPAPKRKIKKLRVKKKVKPRHVQPHEKAARAKKKVAGNLDESTRATRFSEDSAFDLFRSFFSVGGKPPPPPPHSASSSPPPTPSSPQSQSRALENLISSQRPPPELPEELRTALASLVDFSSVFSTRRLSPLAKDPADHSRPRHPPPHFNRLEPNLRLGVKPGRKVRRTDVGTDRGGRARHYDEDISCLQEAQDSALDYSYRQHPALTLAPPPLAPLPPITDAIKLNVIHARYHHFLSHPDVRTVVDVGAGSGSWSLFVGYKLSKNPLANPSPSPSTPNFRDLFDLKDFVLDDSPSPSLHPTYSPKRKLIALDTLPLPFLPGIQRIQSDFLDPRTPALIDAALVGPTAPGVVYTPEGAHEELDISSSGVGRTEAPGKTPLPLPRAPPKPLQTIDVFLSDMVPCASGTKMIDAARSLEMCRRAWEFARVRLRTEDQVGRKGGGVLL
ncbi:hypothetical protein C0995_010178 [Termitomyces sp. Mi166|nr:hypothetical protein C0995_010178 [Termitomyces sp. Mi166\